MGYGNMYEQAKKVIAVLNSRKGFDPWWHDIDKEYQDEILKEIQGLFDDFYVENRE